MPEEPTKARDPSALNGIKCFHSGVFLGQALYAVGRAGRDFRRHPKDAARSIKDAKAGLNQPTVKNLPGVKRIRESLGRIKWKKTPKKKLQGQLRVLAGELLKVNIEAAKRCTR